MRFITSDEDRKVAEIVDRAREAAGRAGSELEVVTCRHPAEVSEGLSNRTGPVLLMTHGFFGEDAFTNNGADEKYQVTGLNDMAPARIGSSAFLCWLAIKTPLHGLRACRRVRCS